MSVLFECKDLRKNYGKKAALKGISFELESGQIVGLLGPNGSGKTTIIKIANGLLTSSAGEIKIAGNKIGEVAGEIVAGYKSKAGGTSSTGSTAPDIIVDAKDIKEHVSDEE